MISRSKGEAQLVLRRFSFLILCFTLLASTELVGTLSYVRAQDKPAAETKPVAKETPKAAPKADGAQITADQIVELAIYMNGSREGLAQIRRSGVERGRIKRVLAEGKIEEATYERRFIRGENTDKDRIRLEQRMPTAEFSLVFASGEVWGIINNTPFTPREETTQEFRARQLHGVEALLRYKEDGSTLAFVGKDKQKGLDLYIIDVTDKEQRKTRYYISSKSARVLWLEYEQAGSSGVKFTRKFHDYRLAQGTLVPFRTVLYKDGTQIEETQILTITFGPKLDESLFRNPNSPPPTTASTP